LSYYILDSSALVKRYMPEPGSAWIKALTAASSGYTIVVAQITSVETVSAITRRMHAGSISTRTAKAARLLIDRHFIRQYDKVRLTTDILLRAEDLLAQYPLRAADAIQLSSALEAHKFMVQRGLPQPIFVCADHRLLAAAIAEGLRTDDPNLYP